MCSPSIERTLASLCYETFKQEARANPIRRTAHDDSSSMHVHDDVERNPPACRRGSTGSSRQWKWSVGAIGQGSPDITRPGKGGDATQRGSGSTKESIKAKKQGHESSGRMGKDSLGQPSGEPTDRGIGTVNGSDSGTGAESGSRGDTFNSPGGTTSGTIE